MKANRLIVSMVLVILIVSQVSCCNLWEGRSGARSIEFDPTATVDEHTFAVTATAAYAEDCDAYDSIFVEAVITEQAQYDTWSSCQYSLRVTNNLSNQDIWLWIHHIHATEGGIDRDEWDSAMVEAGTTEEWTFSGSFQNDGSFGHSYAGEITAILAVPECNEMRSRANAITLARAMEWFCGP